MLYTILLVILVLTLFGGGWGYRSGHYGAPTMYGGFGLILIIVVLVLLFGR